MKPSDAVPAAPTIAVITATYNAAAVLPDLLASLRAQTDRNFECIIADGGSTDSTLDILRASGDIVTCWKSEPDFGIYDAFNKAIKLSTSNYYVVLGADDIFLPNAIATFRSLIQDTHGDIMSGAIHIKGLLRSPAMKLKWRQGIWSFVSGHSVGALIRRSLHDEIGYYGNRYYLAADMEFLYRTFRQGKKLTATETPVGTFTTFGASNINLLGTFLETIRVRMESGNSFLGEILLFVLYAIRHYRRIISSQRNLHQNIYKGK